jgi:hypothetical protein
MTEDDRVLLLALIEDWRDKARRRFSKRVDEEYGVGLAAAAADLERVVEVMRTT